MTALLDARGYPRGPATLPGFRAGVPPRSKGRRYPADPPTIEEIVRLLAVCPDSPHGRRLRALIVLLWRSGLRIHEALLLEERDLTPHTGAIVVRRGKGGKRRVVGMDEWAWAQVARWLDERQQYPVGPVFCVLTGPTAGRAVASTQVRKELRKLRTVAGVRRRVAPHQFRHLMAVEWVREAQPIHLLQRQLGHANLAITTTYLAGVSSEEVVEASARRRAPQMPVPDLMGVLRVG